MTALEAVLREVVDPELFGYIDATYHCGYCCAPMTPVAEHENHAAWCPITRARALLEAQP